MQHKQLFVRLFEWFNFKNVTDKEKVLNLLLNLASVSSYHDEILLDNLKISKFKHFSLISMSQLFKKFKKLAVYSF